MKQDFETQHNEKQFVFLFRYFCDFTETNLLLLFAVDFFELVNRCAEGYKGMRCEMKDLIAVYASR